MSTLSHFDAAGASRMVDVSDKAETTRTATASAIVTMSAATWNVIRDRQISKGDVLEVARLAGIMAAKQTPSLIPLCHPLPITGVTIDYVEPTIDAPACSANSRAHDHGDCQSHWQNGRRDGSPDSGQRGSVDGL